MPATKHFAVALIAVIALTAASPNGGSPGLSAALKPTLGKKQVIKQWGYSIRTVKDWNSIPAQPGETKVVGKWEPDFDEMWKRGIYDAQGASLQILRFDVQGATTSLPGDAEKDQKREDAEREVAKRLGRNFEKRMNPKSVDDFIEGRWEGASLRFSPKKITAGKGSKKLTGKLIEFTGGASYICCAVFRRNNVEWGVFYSCQEGYYEKVWEKLFKKSISSFALFEPEGQPKLATAGKAKDLKGDAKREHIKAGIAGNPGWYAIDSENYVFLSNSSKKAFIKRLAKEIEVIRAKVYEELFPPQKDVDAICIVRVLGTQAEYHQYGGPRGSAGYWNAGKEELVLFDNFDGVTKKNSKAFTKSVMYHEAFHQYIYYAVGDLAPHSWYNEGHGDFFAGMRVAGSSVRFRPFDWRVDFLKRHIGAGKNLIPIQGLVRLPQNEYYSNAGLKYSQGWAFIYFLRRATKNKAWKEIPDRYFSYLTENVAAFRKKKKEEDDESGEETAFPGIPGIRIVDWEDREKVDQILKEAVDHAFEGIDYGALDKRFNSWVRSIL